jgi:hypothetical protein
MVTEKIHQFEKERQYCKFNLFYLFTGEIGNIPSTKFRCKASYKFQGIKHRDIERKDFHELRLTNTYYDLTNKLPIAKYFPNSAFEIP